jgi:hypothetical protein
LKAGIWMMQFSSVLKFFIQATLARIYIRVEFQVKNRKYNFVQNQRSTGRFHENLYRVENNIIPGVTLWFQITSTTNYVPNKGTSKMGFINTK